MPDSSDKSPMCPEEEKDGDELAHTIAQAREARRTRRRQERERHRAAAETRRPQLIYTTLTTVSGTSEYKSQREARTSARLEMRTHTRRVVCSMLANGELRTEVFDLVDDAWASLGVITLDHSTA